MTNSRMRRSGVAIIVMAIGATATAVAQDDAQTTSPRSGLRTMTRYERVSLRMPIFEDDVTPAKFRSVLRNSIDKLKTTTSSAEQLIHAGVLCNLGDADSHSNLYQRPAANRPRLSSEERMDAVRALIPLCSSNDEEVRLTAFHAITRYDYDGRIALPKLLVLYTRTDPKVSRYDDSSTAFQVGLAIASLDSQAPNQRSNLPARPFVPGNLERRGEDPVAPMDDATVAALQQCEGSLAETIAAFTQALKTSDSAARAFAVRVLAYLAHEDPQVKAAVLGCADDADPDVRANVLAFLTFHPVSDETTKLVRKELRSADKRMQHRSLRIVRCFGADGIVWREDIADILRRCAAHPDQNSRLIDDAVLAWAAIGAPPQLACDAIVRYQETIPLGPNGERSDRARLLGCMVQLESVPEEMLATLAEWMTATDYSRSDAAYAFARLGGDAEHATRLLLERGRDSHDPRLSMLARMGRVHLPAVIELLDSADARTRFVSAMILEKSGHLAANALPKLRTLLQDPDSMTAMAAKNAIESIEWELAHPEEAKQLRRLPNYQWW